MGGGMGGAPGGGDKINDSIYVPSEAVGMIIGKGGETIREMQSQTGCKINVSQSSGPGEVEREIGLVGSRDAISRAKLAIEDKVEAVVSNTCTIQQTFISFLTSGDSDRRTVAAVVVVEAVVLLVAIMITPTTPSRLPTAPLAPLVLLPASLLPLLMVPTLMLPVSLMLLIFYFEQG